MDIHWQQSINIAAPFTEVYRYLADFPRHSEWTQTIERLELLREGDSSGVGAQYQTIEHQAMQTSRRPFEPLMQGEVIKTVCEIRELSPSYRIVWEGRGLSRKGLHADLIFDVNADETGGTKLRQTIHLHTSRAYDLLDRFRAKTDPVIVRAQLTAQWEAGLRNIKLILEDMTRRVILLPTEQHEEYPVLQERERGA